MTSNLIEKYLEKNLSFQIGKVRENKDNWKYLIVEDKEKITFSHPFYYSDSGDKVSYSIVDRIDTMDRIARNPDRRRKVIEFQDLTSESCSLFQQYFDYTNVSYEFEKNLNKIEKNKILQEARQEIERRNLVDKFDYEFPYGEDGVISPARRKGYYGQKVDLKVIPFGEICDRTNIIKILKDLKTNDFNKNKGYDYKVEEFDQLPNTWFVQYLHGNWVVHELSGLVRVLENQIWTRRCGYALEDSIGKKYGNRIQTLTADLDVRHYLGFEPKEVSASQIRNPKKI